MKRYDWTIAPTGIAGADGVRKITRLLYNLTVTDGEGAKGDLGAPGIIYLSEPVPAENITPPQLVRLLGECLGADTVAMFKCIAEKNLASFEGETVTVGG